ncbi:unnamed protein product [Thelazia callipaeda]|uniref:CRC domain-containing protein n=1 Tax=Thelazia callipaeda TaxID=103827 RepID=A0A0N5D4V5_THECL|nr:unnamed protein product [Thelazia callipaeda]
MSDNIKRQIQSQKQRSQQHSERIITHEMTDETQIYEDVIEETDVGDDVEDVSEYRFRVDNSYRTSYIPRISSVSSAGNSQLHYNDSQHQRISREPSSSQFYNSEVDQLQSTHGRAVPAHVFAVRGNRIYRIDRSGGSTTSTPIRTLNETMRRSGLRQENEISIKKELNWQKQDVPSKSKFVSSSLSPPLNYRSAQARIQHNRLLAPSMPSKLAPKKRPLGSKKPCHCTRSMCLKLYCDCFANGEFCNECDCKDCKNTIEYEIERTRAIRLSLERNPNAFKPKIGVATDRQIEPERLHQKGCHCKKSNCLKNYCECYEAKVPCTDRCKCICCRNTESDRAARLANLKPPMVLADFRAAIAANNIDVVKDMEYSEDDDDEGDRSNSEPHDPKALPWFYMTDEVVEAATLCLVAQAEEMESSGLSSQVEIEKAVLQEFGRCLGQIIDNALKNGGRAV